MTTSVDALHNKDIGLAGPANVDRLFNATNLDHIFVAFSVTSLVFCVHSTSFDIVLGAKGYTVASL